VKRECGVQVRVCCCLVLDSCLWRVFLSRCEGSVDAKYAIDGSDEGVCTALARGRRS